MHTQKPEHRNVRMGIKCIILFIITVIGGYGIVTAPESDQDQLKQELQKNAQTLELADTATSAGIAGPEGSALPEASVQPERSITVIGDSVFLGAAPSYQKLEKNAVVNAKISRQVYHGLDVAKKLEKKGKLGNTVLIALGTNGKFNEVTGQELIDYLGTERTIYWITAYGKKLSWQKEVNHTIAKLAQKNPNVHLIPWAKEAKKHPDWFYQDGTHLNTKGQKGFAEFIVTQTDS